MRWWRGWVAGIPVPNLILAQIQHLANRFVHRELGDSGSMGDGAHWHIVPLQNGEPSWRS
jgi:hypothetical protein